MHDFGVDPWVQAHRKRTLVVSNAFYSAICSHSQCAFSQTFEVCGADDAIIYELPAGRYTTKSGHGPWVGQAT